MIDTLNAQFDGSDKEYISEKKTTLDKNKKLLGLKN